MIRGRGSSYGTFIGALSLAAVVSSLYLSPLGTSPDHKRAMTESDTRVASVSSALAKRTDAKSTQKRDPHTTKGAVPVKTVTRTLPGNIVKDVVYAPSSTPKPAATTTTATAESLWLDDNNHEPRQRFATYSRSDARARSSARIPTTGGSR